MTESEKLKKKIEQITKFYAELDREESDTYLWVWDPNKDYGSPKQYHSSTDREPYDELVAGFLARDEQINRLENQMEF